MLTCTGSCRFRSTIGTSTCPRLAVPWQNTGGKKGSPHAVDLGDQSSLLRSFDLQGSYQFPEQTMCSSGAPSPPAALLPHFHCLWNVTPPPGFSLHGCRAPPALRHLLLLHEQQMQQSPSAVVPLTKQCPTQLKNRPDCQRRAVSPPRSSRTVCTRLTQRCCGVCCAGEPLRFRRYRSSATARRPAAPRRVPLGTPPCPGTSGHPLSPVCSLSQNVNQCSTICQLLVQT